MSRQFSEQMQMANTLLIFNILNHIGNANEKYTKIPSYLNQTGHQQERKQQQKQTRTWGKRDPHTLLVGI
jgi:hypothetical protein